METSLCPLHSPSGVACPLPFSPTQEGAAVQGVQGAFRGGPWSTGEVPQKPLLPVWLSRTGPGEWGEPEEEAG